MHLYIANTSQQAHIVNYRVPENSAPLMRPIEMGRQVLFGDLSEPTINSIVEQLRPYGLLSVEEAGKHAGLTPLVFSTGRPVPSAAMTKVILHNRGLLAALGKESRLAAAIATSGQIEQAAPDQVLRQLDMSVQEETPGTGLDNDGGGISEGVTVKPAPSTDANPPRGRNQRRRAA